MPIPLSEEERQQFFDSHESPGPYLDLLSTAGFRIATAAQRLGIFDALAGSAMNAVDLAEQLETDAIGTEILLEGLEGFGYATRKPEGWTLTPMAARWLQPPDGEGFDYTLVQRFWSLLLFELWGDLEGTVRRGKPGIHLYNWLDERPEAQRTFQAMLGMLANFSNEEILGHLDLQQKQGLPKKLRLIDIGGGHGRHSIAFCQRYPGSEATLLDLPSSLEVAEENAAAAGLTDRIHCQAVDFLKEDLGSGFDVAFLLSIIHSFEPEENIRLLKRIRKCLISETGQPGVLVLLEQLSGEERPELPVISEAFHRAFRLNLFHLLGGRTYTHDEVQGWLEEAGFRTEKKVLLESTGHELLVAHPDV